MDIEKLIQGFDITGVITNETIVELKEDSQARRNLCNYFKNCRNRAFSVYLLKRFIELRAYENFELWIEDLMLASYIVGLHGNIEDSLLIVEAKYADFDTYCGMDGELIAFAGLDQTIHFLKNQNSDEAKMALERMEGFDQKEITEYFEEVECIWWI